ncbi:MAG TPA: type II secretion system F family protein [Tepidisphaeraceae bacterium]|nr:type II secretion system F family protein [Tepidisphaeraceae bacterium]
MTTFAYTALDRNGRQQTGTIPADNRAAAMDHVLGQGLSPIKIEEKAGAGANAANVDPAAKPPTKVPAKAIEAFTRELANLLSAGLPLARALALLKREASHPAAKYVWTQIHDDVVGGESLADSLAKWPRSFSSVYVAMVRAGEAGGFLHVVLQQIADFRTREQELRGKMKAAMVYPIALALVATAVLIFLLTFFIPRFSSLFAQFGGNLPGLTKVIVAASGLLTKYGLYVGIAVVFGIIMARRALTSESGKRFIERATLRTPIIGPLGARFGLVRFARMLGTLVGAGVPLVASLKVAKEALGNQTLADSIGRAIEEVQRGQPLSKSLAGNAILFPPSVIEMISVAEETGRLDKELVRMSTSYESELDRGLRLVVAMAEPLLLFLMAGLIGTVVVGMLLPIFSLQDLIK